jgi:hypothetical protein
MSSSYSRLRIVKLMVKGTRREPDTAVGTKERQTLSCSWSVNLGMGYVHFLHWGRF